MQALADCPQSIRDRDELRSFAAHLRTCAECREHVKVALEFDSTFIAPLASKWRHLNLAELAAVRESGFDPELQAPQTADQRHIVFCDKCLDAIQRRP